jgi:hypothetical protein
MATDRLQIYNGALQKIGKRRIASLTVNEESRKELDTVWNDGGVQYCLEQGMWKFATRTMMLDYDTGLTSEFGYQRAFAKADDWCATIAVCSDEFCKVPLLRYSDEAGYIWCDLDRIYVRFTSNDNDWGMNLARWPATFTEYVKTYFAGRVCEKLTGDKVKANEFNKPRGIVEMAESTAKNNDAQDDPPKFPAPSSWVQARRNFRGPGRDGGSRTNLIG